MIDLSFFMELHNWSFEGLIAVLLFITIYFIYVKSSLSQKLFFTTALLSIYLVLGSPIADLTKFGLHSVSMLQHIVLLMLAPILILKALPLGLLNGSKINTWSVFANPKKYFIALWAFSAIVMWSGHYLSAAMTASKTGTAICGIAIPSGSWIANIPEGLIFTTLFIAGILFLLPVLHPDISKRLSPVSSVIYLFSACISCSLLGLYVAFSASSTSLAEALPVFTTLRNPIPMSLRTDQEMAGMLMWVPGCIIYAITSVELILPWYDSNPELDVNAVIEVNPTVDENEGVQIKIQNIID